MNLRDAQRNAIALMHSHGLIADGWTFAFDRAVARFGLCKYGPKVISMSRVLTETATPEQVRNVMLHEIAHALVGHKAGHGWKWARMHREIGGTGARTESYSAEARAVITYRWKGTCERCGSVWHRHKLLARVRETGRCPRDRSVIRWQSGTFSK